LRLDPDSLLFSTKVLLKYGLEKFPFSLKKVLCEAPWDRNFGKLLKCPFLIAYTFKGVGTGRIFSYDSLVRKLPMKNRDEKLLKKIKESRERQFQYSSHTNSRLKGLLWRKYSKGSPLACACKNKRKFKRAGVSLRSPALHQRHMKYLGLSNTSHIVKRSREFPPQDVDSPDGLAELLKAGANSVVHITHLLERSRIVAVTLSSPTSINT
jgi:hypothetical protein